MTTTLLLGLGNPGREYEKQRHNLGQMAVSAISERYLLQPLRARVGAVLRQGKVAGRRVVAAIPSCYMNESGGAGRSVRDYFDLDNGCVFVLHDDLDLVPGKVRIKRGGGAGGHNGLRSLDAHIGADYWRVRIGIGRPEQRTRVTGHVLGNFSASERIWVEPLLEEMSASLPLLLEGEHSQFMNLITERCAPAGANGGHQTPVKI